VEGYSNSKIYNLFTDKPFQIAGKDLKGEIEALCSHNGKLYYSLDDLILETSTRKIIAKAPHPQEIRALCSHEGKLHYTVKQEEYLDGKQYVMDTDTFIQEGNRRDNYAPYNLCSHNGKLYGAVVGRIQDVFAGIKKRQGKCDEILLGKYIRSINKGYITALCSIDDSVFKKILANVKNAKREEW